MTDESAEERARAEEALRALIERFDPEDQLLIRSVRSAIRERFPTTHELVYDYSSSLVISYSPTANGIDSLVSLAARTDGGGEAVSGAAHAVAGWYEAPPLPE